MEAKMAY